MYTVHHWYHFNVKFCLLYFHDLLYYVVENKESKECFKSQDPVVITIDISQELKIMLSCYHINCDHLGTFTVLKEEDNSIPPVGGNSKASLTTQNRLTLAL